jgi:hypothetical protein
VLRQLADKYDLEVLERIEQLEAERKRSNDPFRARNGYNWDWVIVFKVLAFAVPFAPCGSSDR